MQISVALQTDKTPAEYVALAKLIDRYDFDVVSVYCDAPFQPSYAPLLLMAPHLKRARLGIKASTSSDVAVEVIDDNVQLLLSSTPIGPNKAQSASIPAAEGWRNSGTRTIST